ncbi:LysR family transcriptional regulator [Aromatoleum toluclasticum]|uniref:LysR family transcriptional regulator n=1 Tax=Aromatoleum toluclasticum TaxID=92003 RepID=UPI0003A41A6F|nr:LysR family transcriptional regulator [Aromatoleum toluclasticum]
MAPEALVDRLDSRVRRYMGRSGEGLVIGLSTRRGADSDDRWCCVKYRIIDIILLIIAKMSIDRFEALRVFCRIVEMGSFSRTARHLDMSNSSVTNHLTNLEGHLGVRLLNRTTRKLSLTDEGRACYERARDLLDGLGELEEGLRGAKVVPQGVLRVDVPTAIGRMYIAPALPRFAELYPEVTVRMTLGDQVLAPEAAGVDVSIRVGELKDLARVAKTLHRTRYVCCASPDFLARHGTPAVPQDLARYPQIGFLQPTSGQPVPWYFSKGDAAFEQMPEARIWINHAESLIDAAISGGGVVQLFSLSLQRYFAKGILVPILADWSAPGPPISILYPPSRHQPAKISAFVKFVGELFEDQLD